MKLCVNCKHYKREVTKHLFFEDQVKESCKREFETVIRQSPVTGMPEVVLKTPKWLWPMELDLEFERSAIPIPGGFMDGAVCEPDGKFWEAK